MLARFGYIDPPISVSGLARISGSPGLLTLQLDIKQGRASTIAETFMDSNGSWRYRSWKAQHGSGFCATHHKQYIPLTCRTTPLTFLKPPDARSELEARNCSRCECAALRSRMSASDSSSMFTPLCDVIHCPKSSILHFSHGSKPFHREIL